ncbi:hypothetical protein [Salipaludibacillus aurantiacus]|uniref:Uncharacterized protein n=1 Tax=Salipaludibacillus aurantiacus TaxID=1601833 RepID=A0A1H9RE47_9BACI|nr:hypothetical protein [Salipaludibacillus aurantiacus]SER70982.1 hypothetical protein SAMN05518684_103106 [Salipaludibacillus aurantiacus]
MSQIFLRGVILSAVLMFGFILGVIYSDQETDLTADRFNVIKTEENPEPEEGEEKLKFKVKETPSNIIEMEESEGLVVYHNNSHEEIQDLLDEPLPLYVEKSDTDYLKREPSPLFSELGIKTAEAFEQAFSKMFSLID